MIPASLAFYPFACLSLASALLAVTRRSPRQAVGWLVVSLVSVAGLFLLLVAPALALVQAGAAMGVAALGAALPSSEQDESAPSWTGRIIGALSVGGLAFVLLGTAARQYVSFGADLDRSPEFGELRALGQQLFTVGLIPAVGLGLLLGLALVTVTRATGEERVG